MFHPYTLLTQCMYNTQISADSGKKSVAYAEAQNMCLSRICDVMVSYLGTPPVATFEIEGSAVGKYIISGKGHHSPNTEYEICMYLKWKFSLNIMPISTIFCLVGYLHTPWTCCKKLFMKRLSSRGGELILCLVFYFDADMPLLIWSVLHVCGLVRIPKHCVKMLHKTVHKTVGLLWR